MTTGALSPPDAREQLRALMDVSAAVVEGRELGDTLTLIAEAAARLLRASAAAIILRSPDATTGLVVAASYGLTARYHSYLNDVQPIEVGKGPSGIAAATAQPVVIEDVLDSPIFGPWRDIAVHENYRSMISVPMRAAEGEAIGVLNTYRGEPSAWRDDEVDLLELLAGHATVAVRTIRLLDDSRRQVTALSLMVRSLRTQAHEHANRLHAIHGLLAIGEGDEARRLVASVQDAYYSSYASVTGRIANPVLAGLLVAETAVAGQSGITIAVDRRTRIGDLPPGLDDLDGITILGNLLHNALDAVSTMPPSRRRISVLLRQTEGETVLRVRDWGVGIDEAERARIFERDYTTKDGHAGVGLTLVRDVVKRVRGRIEVESPRGGGLAVSVRIPA